jgi:tRNA(Arg) A34 adenosine deaminase TadA
VQYDPARYPDRNRERRNTVLDLMAQQGYITAAQAASAKREPVRTVPNGGIVAVAPWFVDVVRIQAERAGVAVREGGFRIHTTLDPQLQEAAVASLREQLDALEKRPGWRHPTYARYHATADSGARGKPGYLQGVVVAIEPGSGEVRALVGGRDHADSPFDRAVDGQRQPGSSFKPIVYAAALSAGLTANAPVGDTAIAIRLPEGRTYAPDNADEQFLGIVPLREALVRSRNPVAVQLAQLVSIDTVAALARRFGIRSPIARYPSSALGASAVQPLDFVTSYATFANLGVAVEPRLVARVEDRTGKVVWTPPRAAPTLALDPRVAFIVRDMMRDAVERGTATSGAPLRPGAHPGRRQDGDDQRQRRRVVRRHDARPRRRRVARLRPAEDDHPRRGRRLARRPIWGQMVARWYATAPPQLDAPRGAGGGGARPADRLPADSTTPPDRRYTEYFVEGTEPGAAPFTPWSLFRSGPVLARADRLPCADGHPRPHAVEVALPDWVDAVVDWDRPYATDEDKMRLAIALSRENVARAPAARSAPRSSRSGRAPGRRRRQQRRAAEQQHAARGDGRLPARAGRRATFSLSAEAVPRTPWATSCDPCAMCLGATLWSGVRRVRVRRHPRRRHAAPVRRGAGVRVVVGVPEAEGAGREARTAPRGGSPRLRPLPRAGRRRLQRLTPGLAQRRLLLGDLHLVLGVLTGRAAGQQRQLEHLVERLDRVEGELRAHLVGDVLHVGLVGLGEDDGGDPRRGGRRAPSP